MSLIEQFRRMEALEALTHDEEGRVFPDEMFTDEEVEIWLMESRRPQCG